MDQRKNNNLRRMNQYSNQRVNPNYNQIDLIALAKVILNKWMIVLIGFVIGVGVGYLYIDKYSEPIYSSSAQVYLKGDNGTISLESLYLANNMRNDYKVIFTSRPNLEKVVKKLKLDMSAATLKSMLTIENIDETHIIQVTARANSPELAKDIANQVMLQGMDSIRELESNEPYIVEKAIENPYRVNGSVMKSSLYGGILGMMIVCGYISILFIMNDNILSRDDIENHLGIPVLTTVLEDSSFSSESEKKRKRKKD